MRLLRLTALLCSLLLLAGCGHKGPVRPLKAKRPGPATALELRQQGEALLLSWQLPKNNIDGSAIEEPPVLDIYRMTYDYQADCPECFDRSTLLFSIEPELPNPARKVGDRYLLLDRQVDAGTGYQYKFIARGEDAVTGSPVILRLPFAPPVAAVEKLEIVAHDRAIALKWQAVEVAEGDSLLGYQVYRKVASEERSAYPLNPEPLLTTSFDDFNLDNGRSYSYSIRTLVKRNDQTIEGIATPELSAVPKAGQ